MSGIRLGQILDGLTDGSRSGYKAVPNNWDGDSVLLSIKGNISNYWQLSSNSTIQTPSIGSQPMSLIGASTGIVPARCKRGPDNLNPAVWCLGHQDYYLTSTTAIGPSGDFSVWAWFMFLQQGNSLNFLIDWERDPAVDSNRRSFMMLNQITPRIQSLRTTSADMSDPNTGTASIGRQPTLRWDLVVWTHDASENEYYSYYNGSYVGVYSLSTLDLSTSPLNLNRLRDSAAGGTTSYIAHCGYMNGYVMTQEEIAALWNNGTGRFI